MLRKLLKLNHFLYCLSSGCLHRVIMASDDISQLADALSKTHVGDGELSYKGLGLKLDNAASGQMLYGASERVSLWFSRHCVLEDWPLCPLQTWSPVLCAFSGGPGPWDRAVPGSESFAPGGQHCGSGCSPGHRQGSGEQRPTPGTPQIVVCIHSEHGPDHKFWLWTIK